MDRITASVVQEFIRVGIDTPISWEDLKKNVAITERDMKKSIAALEEKTIIAGCNMTGYRLTVDPVYKH